MAVASLPPSLLVQAEPSLCKTLLSDLPQSLSTLSTCSLISGDNQLIMQVHKKKNLKSFFLIIVYFIIYMALFSET